jgi:hypothetical protein
MWRANVQEKVRQSAPVLDIIDIRLLWRMLCNVSAGYVAWGLACHRLRTFAPSALQ